MYKLVINNADEPSYIRFENNQPNININPGETITVALKEGSSVKVEKDHVILSGVIRPDNEAISLKLT